MLRHSGGYAASAQLLAERYLAPTESADLDGSVHGLTLAKREALVLAALGDYRTTGHSFKPRLFAGFVERLRVPAQADGNGIVKLHQPADPAPEEPPPDPEVQRAGRELVAQAVKASADAAPPRKDRHQRSREEQRAELERIKREAKP